MSRNSSDAVQLSLLPESGTGTESDAGPYAQAVIHFDGGCSPNPGQKYGSYSVQVDSGLFSLCRTRFRLGYGTNNEAEFEALLMALIDFTQACEKAQCDLKRFQITIYTDSLIVRSRIEKSRNPAYRDRQSKQHNTRSLAMRALGLRCIEALQPFHSFTIAWNSRTVNVARFGH